MGCHTSKSDRNFDDITADGGSVQETTDSTLDLSPLYKVLGFRGQAWNVISHASAKRITNALNVAFPAFQCEYWITCFSGPMTVTFEGSFPKWADYAALTLYDSEGLVLVNSDGSDASINFAQSDYAPGKTFTWSVDIPAPCIVLNRLYTPRGEKSLSDAEKFKITENNKVLTLAPSRRAFLVGKLLQPALQYVLGKSMSSGGTVIEPNQQMYKAPKSALPGLFPNANAIYILTKMNDSTSCLKFVGEIPSKADNKSGQYKFYGFMACDFSTTATIQSINQANMGGFGSGRYTLFFARQEADAVKEGYSKQNKRHFLLTVGGGRATEPPSHSSDALEDAEDVDDGVVEWMQSLREKAEAWTREEPVSAGVILRVINTAGQGTGEGGLWSAGLEEADGSISAQNCMKALGRYYPRLHTAGGGDAPKPSY